MSGPISRFMDSNFLHFNAATLVRAACEYDEQLRNGSKMMITLAGAMSTAELGISLAEMIRKGKVHAISCTGANLEEDLFNLVAHNSYVSMPNYRNLTPIEEHWLLESHLNRVTDTCIPEHEAFRKIEQFLTPIWDNFPSMTRYFPHQFIYELFRRGDILEEAEISLNDSWLYAAYEKQLPIYVPGWEDSTLGNIFAAHAIQKYSHDQARFLAQLRSGIEYMMHLMTWYRAQTDNGWKIGFLQIGGGIAGDFPICVVPLMNQDIEGGSPVPLWNYFCQISDSTTSYGSYSGAVPEEKISWGKLGVDTPKFLIESDASIVAPLFFNYVLGK